MIDKEALDGVIISLPNEFHESVRSTCVEREMTQRLFNSSGIMVCFNASSMPRFRPYAQTTFPYRKFR